MSSSLHKISSTGYAKFLKTKNSKLSRNELKSFKKYSKVIMLKRLQHYTKQFYLVAVKILKSGL